jgi:hypothetical protein
MQFPHFGKRMTSRSHNGPPKLFGVLTDASAFDSLATVDDPLALESVSLGTDPKEVTRPQRLPSQAIRLRHRP